MDSNYTVERCQILVVLKQEIAQNFSVNNILIELDAVKQEV